MSPHELFLWSEALPVLLLVPAVGLTLFLLDRARARRLAKLAGPRSPRLAAELGTGRRRMRRRLGTAALLLALIALLQPLWGSGYRRLEQRGVDILVCLDVSRSMLARDMMPSRLQRARATIRALAERIRGDRLGLVVFAGEAHLAVPLTRDMISFAELVELADPLSVLRGGTDLGSALETALTALEGGTGAHEVVLLLTDGEDLERRAHQVAELCRERRIAVHGIGFGSARGSKIAVEDGAGDVDAGDRAGNRSESSEGGTSRSGETFLLDRAGNEVVTALDPESLRRIAEATGGVFLDASTRRRPLVDLYEKRVVPMARKAFEDERRRERKNRFQWPLLIAFLLWILELGLTDRRRSKG